jgi:hypothetical protein
MPTSCAWAHASFWGLATLICEGWLNAAFEGDRHQRRLDIITRIEQRNSLPGLSSVDETNANKEPHNASNLPDEQNLLRIPSHSHLLGVYNFSV